MSGKLSLIDITDLSVTKYKVMYRRLHGPDDHWMWHASYDNEGDARRIAEMNVRFESRNGPRYQWAVIKEENTILYNVTPA